MTQPNPGPAPAAPEPNQNPTPAAPATGPAPATTTTPQPAPPGFVPATGEPGNDDDRAAQLLADAIQQDPGNPDQLGDAGKRALAAERARAKAAEDAQKAQAKQLTDLQEQLKALQPAADIFAQIRKAAVPEDEKTDTEKLADRLAEMEKAAGDERLARLRLEVIQDKKLTKAHAEWLKGETYEELAASADALLALFPATEPAAQPGDPAPEAQPNGQQPAPAGAATAPATTGPKPDPTQGARGAGIDLNSQIQDALSKGDVKTSIALKQQLAAQARNQ